MSTGNKKNYKIMDEGRGYCEKCGHRGSVEIFKTEYKG